MVKDAELYDILHKLTRKAVDLYKENNDFNAIIEKIYASDEIDILTEIVRTNSIAQPIIVDSNGNPVENPSKRDIISSIWSQIGMSTFIFDYISSIKLLQQLEFNKEIFEQYYREFERYNVDKIVDIYSIIPILNFSSDLDLIEFCDEVKIVRLSQDEINQLANYLLNPLYPIIQTEEYIQKCPMCGLPKFANKDLDIATIKKIFSSGFALRIELSLKKDDRKHPEEIIDENKKQIISTLRLLKPGNPVINITFAGHKGFRGPILRGSMSCGYTYPLVPEMNENEKYHFSKEDKEYKSLWKNLQLISLHENQCGIDIGIRKFNDIYTRKFLEDKILDMATLLESTLLYGQEDELTFRLSLRMAHLLKSIRDPNEIYKLIKGFYSIRSKISHEGVRFNDKDQKKLKKIKDNMPVKFRNPYDPNRFVTEMENICRLIIKVLINEMIEKGISIENINNRLENYSIYCKEE